MRKIKLNIIIVIIASFLINLNNVYALESKEVQTTYMENPQFDWQDVMGAKKYKVQIFKNHKIIDEDIIESTISRYVPTKALIPGNYTSRIYAIMASEQGEKEVWLDDYKIKIKEIKNIYRIPKELSLEDIVAIIKEANENTPSKIIFEKAQYNITPDEQSYIFDLSNCKDMIIDGNGSMINIKSNSQVGFLKVDNSNNVSIQNFNIKYENKSYSELKIINTDSISGKFTSVLDNNTCLIKNKKNYINNCGYVLNKNRIIKLGNNKEIFTRNIKKLGNNYYEIALQNKDDIKYLHNDDIFINKIEKKYKLINLNKTNNITLKNIDIETSFDIAIEGQNNERLVLLNVNSDGINLKNSRIAPWIEGCNLGNTSNDIISLTCTKQKILEVLNSKEIVCTDDGITDFKKDDWIVFNFNLNGPKTYETKLIKAERIKDGWLLKFNEALPKSVVKDTFAINHTEEMGQLVIRNNNFYNTFNNAIAITSNRGLIENNIFNQINKTAIVISPSIKGGSITNDLVISNNIIENSGKSENSISGINMKYGTTNCHCNRNINIKNNIIKGFWSGAINSIYTNDSQIYNNKIINDHRILKGGFPIINIIENGNLLLENNIIIDNRRSK